MNSPILPVVSPPEPPPPQTLVCANCHAPLAGEYCAGCGQRHETHVHTVAHFAGEAFESISHADSRLWRTLGYLLTRPGYLTREFFAGRRASYLPPFRLYLVISVLFFLAVGAPEKEVLRIHPDAAATSEGATQARAADSTRNVVAAGDAQGLEEGVRDFCDSVSVSWGRDDNLKRQNIRQACRKLSQDGGRELGAKIVRNLPHAMFLLLPLLALCMKLIYWRPRRYYVEHLLFLVHNHACVFLTFMSLLLIDRIPGVTAYTSVLWFAASLYMAWYLYRGMRNYYGQGRALTLAKYLALGWVYGVASAVVLLLTVLYSAMTA